MVVIYGSRKKIAWFIIEYLDPYAVIKVKYVSNVIQFNHKISTLIINFQL